MNTEVLKKYTYTTSWRALSYYNIYRLLIAFLFVSLYWIGQIPEPLGSYDRNVFIITSHLYLMVTLAAFFFIQFRKPPFFLQVVSHVLIDILVISAFIYSSSGLNSGFGMLMVIAIAGGNLLIPGRAGFFFAALATLSVLSHEIYLEFAPLRQAPNYIHAGILGVTYFFTAMISYVLASRVEFSEALAEQRAVDLQNLGRLNEHIVQRLQSGIIVLDEKYNIRLANESASNLLGLHDSLEIQDIEYACPEFLQGVKDWMSGKGEATFIIKPAKGLVDIQISLVQLHMENKTETLVFLDDVSKLRQEAQQLKLASLGRLTASIAHEVRNPLGAISHAAQLLTESDVLEQEEKRLSTIITEQSVRVNTIIENIMRISRRERSTPSVTNLGDWLNGFVREFKASLGLDDGDIKLRFNLENIKANMDPDQLYQVMWNICENGIRYSRDKPLIEIICDIHQESQRPYIDIIDTGVGINSDISDHLFEPFITSESKGTGLGLFIARELCEANQATLNLYSNTDEGCIFRINFSHPDRKQGIT